MSQLYEAAVGSLVVLILGIIVAARCSFICNNDIIPSWDSRGTPIVSCLSELSSNDLPLKGACGGVGWSHSDLVCIQRRRGTCLSISCQCYMTCDVRTV